MGVCPGGGSLPSRLHFTATGSVPLGACYAEPERPRRYRRKYSTCHLRTARLWSRSVRLNSCVPSFLETK